MQNSTNPATANITFSWMMTIPDGNYSAECYAANILGQTNYSQNNTFQIDQIAPSIDFVTPTTTSGYTSQNWISANVTATDAVTGIQNITTELFNNTFNRINFTNSTTSPVYINFTLLLDGTYYINATAFDNANNSNSTETRNITLDTIQPNIVLVSPLNGTSTSITTVNFTFNLIDATPSTCFLRLNDVIVANQSNLITGTYGFIQTLALRNYNWNITCNDSAGNSNTSVMWTVTIIPVDRGLGGGGGGGAGNIQGSYDILVQDELCEGETAQVNIRNNLGQELEGEVEIQYKEQTGWTIFQKLTLSNGMFTFAPTKLGVYNIIYQQKSKIVQVQNCAPIETPFASILQKEQEVQREILVQKIKEFEEEPLLQMEKIAATGLVVKDESVNLVKKYPQFIIGFLILTMLVFMLMRKKHKKAPIKKKKPKLINLEKIGKFSVGAIIKKKSQFTWAKQNKKEVKLMRGREKKKHQLETKQIKKQVEYLRNMIKKL